MDNDLNSANYGYSLENPIHVSGFYEERVYIENLYRKDGCTPVRCRRLGSNISRATGHPTDLYEIEPSGLLSRPDVIYIDLYGESDWRAPEGYELGCGRPPREEGEPEQQLGDELEAMIKAFTSRLK